MEKKTTKKDEIMFVRMRQLANKIPQMNTETGQYCYQMGFNDAIEYITNKACEYLKELAEGSDVEDLLNNFKKAMEE